MDFLQLPGDELAKLSDEELGEWLITTWICDHAKRAGFAPGALAPEQARPFTELAKRLIEETAKVDSESVANALLESAFRKACKGDMAAAGRMLRSYMANRAAEQVGDKFANIGIRQTVGLTRAGLKGAASNKAAAAPWHASCKQKALALLAQGKTRRELAAILAPQFSVTARQVRAVLKKAEVT